VARETTRLDFTTGLDRIWSFDARVAWRVLGWSSKSPCSVSLGGAGMLWAVNCLSMVRGLPTMWILIILLLLLLGGGGGYYGHSRWGYGGGAGIGLGTILVILLVVYMLGGLHF
jgi:hypothetical protein